MRKSVVFAAVALLAQSGFAPSTQAEETLRLGIEAAYPPFATKAPNGSIVGFDYDIGNALCAEMKVKCQWVEQEFDGLIPALKVRKIDVILSSLSVTDERKRSVDFTNRYYRIPARLVMKSDASYSGPESLKAKRIGVQRATNFDRYVTANFEPAGATIVRYASQSEAFLDLVSGRLDATMASSVTLDEGFLKTEQGKGFAFVGPTFTQEQYFGTGVAIAVRKGDDRHLDMLNNAIAALRADGRYDAIQKKYFDFNIYGD